MDPGSHVGFQISAKNKFGRGPSNEHLWQVWLKSVQRFQRKRVKCEKLTDGRWTLTHDKSSPGYRPGELKIDQYWMKNKNFQILEICILVEFITETEKDIGILSTYY